MKKKCLITGTTGLIGTHLLPELTQTNDIVAIARKPSILDQISKSNDLEVIPCDLTDMNFIGKLPKKIDIVIHLAQSPHYREFPDKALDVFSVNSLACLQLLEYARSAGAEKFILASSGVVYGEWQKKFSEDENIVIPNKSLGFYHTSKLCAELLAENYTKYMAVSILRFFFVYGPGQKRGMLIPRLVESVMDEKPIFLQGENGIRINPIYVSDAVAAIQHAIKLEGSHKINIAGTEVLDLREIGEIIGRSLGKTPLFDVDAAVSPNHVIGAIEKMKKLLTVPKTSFKNGIENYIRGTYPELCLSLS